MVYLQVFIYLKILEQNKTPLKDYTKEVVMYPQKMVNIKNVDKVLKHPEMIKLVEEVRRNLPEDSLLLVRPSGTEPFSSCYNKLSRYLRT